MFDHSLIKEEFSGLVGLRQTDHPDFSRLSDSLVYNGSNLMLHHPLLNIENLEMTSRNYGAFEYADYTAGTTYNEGDRVEYADKVYESKINANIGNQPDISPDQWELKDLFNLFLEDVYNDAVIDTINDVMNIKRINRQTKTLLSNQRLTTGVGKFTDLIVKEGRLVGVQVKLKHSQNIRAVIDRIGLQLSQANPNMKLYVYHTSQLEPTEVALNHSSVSSFMWHKTDVKLNYMSDSHDVGGVFFIMYDENELVGQAIRKKHNFHLAPCGYCNRQEVEYYNRYSKYIDIRTVEVLAADRNATNDQYLWDIDKTRYVSDNNFGMNFEFTIKCDLTEFIARQKDSFSFAVRDMYAVKLLEVMANSTRKNVVETGVSKMARAELQDEKIGGMGLRAKLEKQLKGVDFELSALDDTCMPCNTKGGIKITSAGLNG